ncbi:hypothetical protein IQ259_22975 [Fortiea sp. LEGE XX443]|uniref:hypothetical protein n=1 Tax=Fortiea sp. LEGE XX443 TaxID=1828611 RepID=UPI001881FB34|nr:hypothetical protein [Fortiea sp. LEGE XX443]MBE9007845.1 hypothetical protein [Fortiea sp. LEGE XX443]
MGIYRAYTKESRPEPVGKATTSEYKTESDSLVGCKTEDLSDSIQHFSQVNNKLMRLAFTTFNPTLLCVQLSLKPNPQTLPTRGEE